MEGQTARIPARSRRQVMDWSLVLASQGIEAAIQSPQSGEGWGLLIQARDYDAAIEALRQYRMENAGWPWQRQVLRGRFVFDWASLAWALLAAFFFWLDSQSDIRPAGLMDPSAVGHGQWWRLFTAIWLHADPGHLGTNSAIGLVLLGLVMGRYGTGAGLLAAYLAGAGGNVAVWVAASAPHRSLGASGMVMGALGLLAVQTFSLWRKTPHALRFIIGGIGGGLMLFILLGLAPGTDVLAHLGGFVSGLVLGSILALDPELAQRSKTNLVCGLVFALLVILPWWRALSSG